jgi:hypothetical protein
VPFRAALTLVPHRALAEPIVALLADNDIASVVRSDDCGGVDPALAFANGTRVMVQHRDLARARQLLIAYENAPQLAPDDG